jgi:hypothetical protein
MGLTRREREILREPIRNIVRANKYLWHDLKYETQYGPEFIHFTYYPSGVELWDIAKDEIAQLSDGAKIELLQQWHSSPRVIRLTSDEEILDRYATVVLDEVVKRARTAGNRTINWG